MKTTKPTQKTLAEVKQIIKYYRSAQKSYDKTIAIKKAAKRLCCSHGWLYAILRGQRAPGRLLKYFIAKVAEEIKKGEGIEK
jgi:hypothetical protein